MDTKKLYNYDEEQISKNKMHVWLILGTLAVNLIIFLTGKNYVNPLAGIFIMLAISLICFYILVLYHLKKQIIYLIKKNNSKANVLLIHGWASKAIIYTVISHLYFFGEIYNVYWLVVIIIGGFVLSAVYYKAIIHLFCEFPILKKAS